MRALEDKYSHTKWSQDDKDKEIQRQIREFDKWAMNVNDSDLKNETKYASGGSIKTKHKIE